MRPTPEMVNSLSLFVKSGSPPATAARWALDLHRHRWPSREAELEVYAELKGRGDAMIRAALIRDQERKAQAERADLPAWMVAFRTVTAWVPPTLPPAPLPVLSREQVKALFDARRYVHHAQRGPLVKPWAILWAMRLGIALTTQRLMAARRRQVTAEVMASKGWKFSERKPGGRL
jgi:hypothetical protein